jgi:hypothetical protein
MTRQNVPLGKILGLPIGLDYSWKEEFQEIVVVLKDPDR